MRRIYPPHAYSDAPRARCWWPHTVTVPDLPALAGEAKTEVAIIGGGFTGLSAALHLAEAGVKATLLEAAHLGWGASGRNGGFCCLGGGMLENAALERRFGTHGRRAWRQTEVAAVEGVAALIDRLNLKVDRHSRGETQLAHRPRDFEDFKRNLDSYAEDYGTVPRLTAPKDLAGEGMNAGFHGALTLPVGFGLNPLKYLSGLAQAALAAGAQIYPHSAVTALERRGEGFVLSTAQGQLRADRVILATNGYSAEDLPPWLAGRYMPAQSTVLVTRPLTPEEISAQGWHSAQACYDSRHLLHYFRLMPDGRMLFGLRGGLHAAPRADARAIARARADFERIFPAWAGVETPHGWSGMVCLARRRMPYAGPVPGLPGVFVGMCYHGNGVAMGSHTGALLADLVRGQTPDRPYPEAMQQPLARFELGRWRRLMMPLVYAGLALADR